MLPKVTVPAVAPVVISMLAPRTVGLFDVIAPPAPVVPPDATPPIAVNAPFNVVTPSVDVTAIRPAAPPLPDVPAPAPPEVVIAAKLTSPLSAVTFTAPPAAPCVAGVSTSVSRASLPEVLIAPSTVTAPAISECNVNAPPALPSVFSTVIVPPEVSIVLPNVIAPSTSIFTTPPAVSLAPLVLTAPLNQVSPVAVVLVMEAAVNAPSAVTFLALFIVTAAKGVTPPTIPPKLISPVLAVNPRVSDAVVPFNVLPNEIVPGPVPVLKTTLEAKVTGPSRVISLIVVILSLREIVPVVVADKLVNAVAAPIVLPKVTLAVPPAIVNE